MKKLKQKANHNHNSSDKDDDHAGMHFSKVQYWKLIIAFPAMFFALWATISEFGTWIPEFMTNPWFLFSFATFSLIIFIWDYITPILFSIKHKKLSITLFLAIAALTTYIYSLVILGINHSNVNEYWESQLFSETIEITYIVYLGHVLETYITSKTQKDMDSILSLFEKQAIKIIDGKEIKVDTKTLQKGDIVLVKNGSKFPVDGRIIEGITTVDESTFTGESLPINKLVGSSVYGGSISEGGVVLVEVTHTLKESMVSKIIESVKIVRSEKNKPAKIANKLSNYVLPFILIFGVGALFLWGFITNDWNKAFSVFVTTIIVACPMSFILLPPTSSLISSAVAAKKGIMFNSPDIFEQIKEINAIAFDKTGTLTEGKLKLIKTTIDSKLNGLVVGMEKISTHPIANAIVEQLETKEIIKINAKETPGYGISATYNNKSYYFGSYSFIKKFVQNFEDENWIVEEKKKGATFSYLVCDSEILGAIELQDSLKPSAIKAVKKIKQKNIEIFVLTGDNETAAKYIASKLEISPENVFANLKPENKSSIISDLQKKGKVVAFVGDGINDTIGLEKADVGIAVGTGSDIAIDSSDIVLKKNDLNLILMSLKIAISTLNTIKFGIIGASLFILSIVPIAAAGLIIPIFGAVSMVANDLWPLFVSSTLFRYKFKK